MENWKMVLTLAYTVLLFLSLQVINADVSLREAYFHFDKGRTLGMSPLQATWTNTSLVWCGKTCKSHDGLCYSFTYNQNTGTCMLGSWASPILPAPTPEEGNLHYSGVCDTGQQFEIWQSNLVSMCVYVSYYNTTITAAERLCQDKASHLLSLENKAKFDLFVNKIQKYRGKFGIGLNDRLSENTFVWHADGSYLTSELRKYIFISDQPDNDGNEDCVEYDTQNAPLNDVSCNREIRYICEKSLM